MRTDIRGRQSRILTRGYVFFFFKKKAILFFARTKTPQKEAMAWSPQRRVVRSAPPPALSPRKSERASRNPLLFRRCSIPAAAWSRDQAVPRSIETVLSLLLRSAVSCARNTENCARAWSASNSDQKSRHSRIADSSRTKVLMAKNHCYTTVSSCRNAKPHHQKETMSVIALHQGFVDDVERCFLGRRPQQRPGGSTRAARFLYWLASGHATKSPLHTEPLGDSKDI